MMRSFYARASWPEGCKPATMPNEAENEVCSLDRQHLIRTCFVDFDRSIVLVAEGVTVNEMLLLVSKRRDASFQEMPSPHPATVEHPEGLFFAYQTAATTLQCLLLFGVSGHPQPNMAGHEDGEKCIMGAGRISREEMSDDVTFSLQVLPSCRKKGARFFHRAVSAGNLHGCGITV